MSLSEVVDGEYRLRVADLGGEPLRVRIVNVSYQGLEEMTPVLHFAGQTRRLHLTQAQCRSLIELTGTATPSGWVGHTVELHPVFLGGVWKIEIDAPGRRRVRPRLPKVSERIAGWLTATIIVTVALLLAAWYVSTHYAQLAAVWEQISP
jgi:hypothetical protein